jgi:hypothetical protein
MIIVQIHLLDIMIYVFKIVLQTFILKQEFVNNVMKLALTV